MIKKRVFDFIAALLGLLLIWWVFPIVALLIRWKMPGGSAFFCQRRVGKDGKLFTCHKFRTMTDAKDADGNLLPDEVRLTKFGKLLRSTSLDELPELFNILKGDMAIVGPRPLLVQYLPRYNERQHHRHDVRPGFTGLAQVNGRNSISWQEKFEWDVRYVENVMLLVM